MPEIAGFESNTPEEVAALKTRNRTRNWSRCIIYRTANVRLIPVRPELSGVLAAADVHFDTGEVYLEARGLPDPATLGRDPAAKQPLTCYVGWAINPNTRVYKNLGALQPRARGGFGLQASSDAPLEYLNLLLVTVQANEGGNRPGPLVVLAGAVCSATPVAAGEEPAGEPAEELAGKVTGSQEPVGEAAISKKTAKEVAGGEKPGEEKDQPASQVAPTGETGYGRWPQQSPTTPTTPTTPAAPATSAACSPSASYRPENIYVVQIGDTLEQIARCFGTTPEALAMRNFIANPNYVYPGQILYVPWPPAR